MEFLEEYTNSKECKVSSALIELALSMKHHSPIFKTIITSVEDPNNDVRNKIEPIKEPKERLSSTMALSNYLPEDGGEVPAISPYELAIHIIVDKCTRARQTKGPKGVMG